MQISALLLTIAAAAVANAQVEPNPDRTFPATDLTKCDEILNTANYVAPEVFSAESCDQKFDCYEYVYNSMGEGHWNRETPDAVTKAISDCDHCFAKALGDCPDTHGRPVRDMKTADRECLEKSYKECKPGEDWWVEPAIAPAEDAGHRTGMSSEEGNTSA